MGTKETEGRTRRGVTINLRADAKQCALIDRAAAVLGKNRSKFMLETACREAGSVLDDKAYKSFVAELDRPPAANARLRRLLHSKAPWEQ